jgi:hypothetical protein
MTAKDSPANRHNRPLIFLRSRSCLIYTFQASAESMRPASTAGPIRASLSATGL